jgi:hypothetical protein
MSSLANLPEVVGFFSYSREDDEGDKGTLSALRDGIQRELSAQLGLSKTNFRLWQDQKAIAPGKLWEAEIKKAVEESVFFIPIVTPRAVRSRHCKFEFETFLARERALGRTDLVFPLLYIGVRALENEAQWRTDPVLSIVGMRQYVDWRPLRHLDVGTTKVRQEIERLCDKIAEALRAPWASPKQREIEARLQIGKKRPIRAEAPRDLTISAPAFSIEQLSGTMSNPKFENDLVKLHSNKYMSTSIIGKETIIIVIGNRIPAELLDRPIAECLRDQIDERGGRDRFRRAVVLTDLAWLAEAENIADNPVIAVGGPPANALSREFCASVPRAPGEGIYTIRRAGEVQGFFRRNSAGLPQIGLWGKTAKGTRQAVEHYLRAEEGLDEFLKMAWILPDASSRRRR